MLNAEFLEKGLEIASPPHLVYDFLRKMLFMLYFINCPNFIVCLPFFSRYWVIYVLQWFVSQVETS